MAATTAITSPYARVENHLQRRLETASGVAAPDAIDDRRAIETASRWGARDAGRRRI